MFRCLEDWLSYFKNLHVRSIDLKLGRLQSVAQILQIKQPLSPVVTVAGTNGKGSVVGFLEALYVNAGYNVAAFTSPYLISFNEQFRFNQQWIEDEKLCHYFEKIDEARGDITLTYFEFKTLAALLYFSELPLDLMILEVGLGGRLDSVNIIDPDIAVITSISLDHCDQLGNTRELIGREKAGIFRANKPAVCGDLNPPNSIQAVANELGAHVFYRNKDFFITEENDTWSWYSESKILKNLPSPYLLKDNIATALQVSELLNLNRVLSKPSLSSLRVLEAIHLNSDFSDGLPRYARNDVPCGTLGKSSNIKEEIIRKTIATATVSGRQQIISQAPFIVVDVSHNEESVRRLAKCLDNHHKKNVTAVFSVLKTKDAESMVRVIAPYIAEWHIAEIDHPSAMPLKGIQSVLRGLNVLSYTSIKAAYQGARLKNPEATIVFGSFHVASDVLAILKNVVLSR